MQVFSAISGQSLFDVCLNTYGSIDYLYKLIQDNGILNANTAVLSGQQFTWDDSLVINQQVNQAYAASGIYYSTDVSALGSVYTSTTSTPIIAPPNAIPAVPYIPPVPVTASSKMVEYTATGGETFFTDARLIGATGLLSVTRGGIENGHFIYSGTPVFDQILLDNVVGKISFATGSPLIATEFIRVIFTS